MSLAWRIEFTSRAKKQLTKIAPKEAARIIEQLELISQSSNPRAIGKALKGTKFDNLWRYRVGDYRILVTVRSARSDAV